MPATLHVAWAEPGHVRINQLMQITFSRAKVVIVVGTTLYLSRLVSVLEFRTLLLLWPLTYELLQGSGVLACRATVSVF